MSTENEVIDEWRERRDMTVAVKERVEHQLRVLDIEVVPGEGPDAGQQQRLEDLQFDLRQLEEACAEAEQKYLTHLDG